MSIGNLWVEFLIGFIVEESSLPLVQRMSCNKVLESRIQVTEFQIKWIVTLTWSHWIIFQAFAVAALCTLWNCPHLPNWCLALDLTITGTTRGWSGRLLLRIRAEFRIWSCQIRDHRNFDWQYLRPQSERRWQGNEGHFRFQKGLWIKGQAAFEWIDIFDVPFQKTPNDGRLHVTS